jgi:hypothetical protein
VTDKLNPAAGAEAGALVQINGTEFDPAATTVRFGANEGVVVTATANPETPTRALGWFPVFRRGAALRPPRSGYGAVRLQPVPHEVVGDDGPALLAPPLGQQFHGTGFASCEGANDDPVRLGITALAG